MGERYLRKELPHKKIDSAGTGALVNHDADSSAMQIANKHGLSLDGHKGQQFTACLAREYDLILVMEKFHQEQISKIAPEARGKTMLFGHWISHREIPDPYRKSKEAFASVYELIEQAGKHWVDKLRENNQEKIHGIS